MFVKRLDSLLNEHNITKRQLAKKANIQSSTLNNIINRGTNPTLPTIIAIATAFNMPITEFLNIPEYNKKAIS